MIVRDFDLGLSALSGQPLTFYADYERRGRSESVTYSAGRGVITVTSRRRGSESVLDLAYGGEYTRAAATREVVNRFALKEDMSRIYGRIDTDPFMHKAVNELRGLRVTQNDPWETTVCFVVSQFNNIKRIRLIINNLSRRFGEEIEVGERKVRLFPTPEALAAADLSSIRACGTGFRDRYIKRVAEECVSMVDLEGLRDLEYAEAKERLLGLDGIGDKVADCILLFGYRKLEAFPIDVWIKRVVETVYFGGRRKSVKQIHRFAERRWQDLSGYANQYIFHQGRVNRIGKIL